MSAVDLGVPALERMRAGGRYATSTIELGGLYLVLRFDGEGEDEWVNWSVCPDNRDKCERRAIAEGCCRDLSLLSDKVRAAVLEYVEMIMNRCPAASEP